MKTKNHGHMSKLVVIEENKSSAIAEMANNGISWMTSHVCVMHFSALH